MGMQKLYCSIVFGREQLLTKLKTLQQKMTGIYFNLMIKCAL